MCAAEYGPNLTGDISSPPRDEQTSELRPTYQLF